MSKGKKKSHKGGGGPTITENGQGRKQKKKQFSMMDEARHTARDHDRRISGRPLEKRNMTFISAGSNLDQSIEEAAAKQPTIVQPQAMLQRSSSSDSISSAEVVLFAGRNKVNPSATTTPAYHIETLSESTSQLHLNPPQHSRSHLPAQQTKAFTNVFSDSRPLALSEDDLDPEIVADYMANMGSSSSGSDSEVSIIQKPTPKGKQAVRTPVEVSDSSSPYQPIAQHIREAKAMNAANDLAAARMSGTNSYTITETQVIRTRKGEASLAATGSNGASNNPHNPSITSILAQQRVDNDIHYLVIYDNQHEGTAIWVGSDKLNNMTENALQFLESPIWESEDSDDSRDSEMQAEQDLTAMFVNEMLEDEELRRMQASMTDEAIARRIAKQEELGMDASEVVMFDGDENMDVPIEYLRQEAVRYSLRSRTVLQRMDSESDFDLMDRERSSIKKSKKGKKKPKFSVVDSDMEKDMNAAWENDRAKKKKRKQEREELRAQGLLGGGAKAKYSNGMALDELKEELRSFLASNKQTMILPPMDKTARKLVHEIAHSFNVKSSSQGNGQNRHPVLDKKLRSRPFSEAAFEGVTNRLMKRFRPHLSIRGQKGTTSKKIFSYREGEIVGSNAPELGSENRGRAMLEKMGWTKGDALGAVNNPGILDPIAHVVRSSRTGLG